MQNIQMMRSKLREEDPNVNMMIRSGTATGEDKRELIEEKPGVPKTPTK